RGVLEVHGLPDRRSHGLRQRHFVAGSANPRSSGNPNGPKPNGATRIPGDSVVREKSGSSFRRQLSRLLAMDDFAVGPVRFLSELLPAFRTPDPRARALWILGLQRTEQLGHLEGDFLGLGLGPMERRDVPHEVDVQVDLRTFRDALEPVRLEAHVEPLAVVEGPERDDVERLTLHAISQDEARGLDCMQCHPPRQGRFHRIAPQSPYATFADTSEYPSGQSSSGPTSTTRIRVPGPMPMGWHSR